MNAYGKMQMLLGFNNPCAAHSPDMVDDNEGMMDIIHESRENSAFIQFLRQNDDINYVYMKMRDTNYSLQEIRDTHKRFNQNEDESVMQLWERIYTLSKIGSAMFVNFDNVENLFFLNENQVLIGMDFINLSHRQPEMQAVFHRMKQMIDICIPELPFMPELAPLPDLHDLPELLVAPNAPRRPPVPLLPRAEMIPRQLFM
jgi:hypothetical protein